MKRAIAFVLAALSCLLAASLAAQAATTYEIAIYNHSNKWTLVQTHDDRRRTLETVCVGPNAKHLLRLLTAPPANGVQAVVMDENCRGSRVYARWYEPLAGRADPHYRMDVDVVGSGGHYQIHALSRPM